MNPTKTERDQWRERLSSPYTCFEAAHADFTIRLLDALEEAEADRRRLELEADWLAHGYTNAVDLLGMCPRNVDMSKCQDSSCMEWTDDPQLGAWNWWKDGDSRIPRYVYQDGTVAITMQIDRVPYQKLGGQWAGPIPEPRPHEPVGEQEKNNVWFQAV